MSRVEVELDCCASPARARSLFTVRAAISVARCSESPRFSNPAFICSYWRSRLLLQARCGIFDGCSSPLTSRYSQGPSPWLIDLGLPRYPSLETVVWIDALERRGHHTQGKPKQRGSSGSFVGIIRSGVHGGIRREPCIQFHGRRSHCRESNGVAVDSQFRSTASSDARYSPRSFGFALAPLLFLDYPRRQTQDTGLRRAGQRMLRTPVPSIRQKSHAFQAESIDTRARWSVIDV